MAGLVCLLGFARRLACAGGSVGECILIHCRILIVLAAGLQRQGTVAHWPSRSSCMLTAILQTGHLLELIYQICFIRHLVGLVFVMRLS